MSVTDSFMYFTNLALGAVLCSRPQELWCEFSGTRRGEPLSHWECIWLQITKYPANRARQAVGFPGVGILLCVLGPSPPLESLVRRAMLSQLLSEL